MNRNFHRRIQLKQSQSGFSLFELVVFIISVAIIYAVAANRFAEFPAAAERANFTATVAQLQAGINLQSMEYVINGQATQAQYFNAANPMDFMLETPSNYIGAFDLVDTERLPRRSWYFDRTAGHLVYLVGSDDEVFLNMGAVEVPSNEIRFQLTIQYSFKDNRGRPLSDAAFNESGGLANPGQRRVFRGLLLEAITPFRWDTPAVDLVEAVNTEPAG